MKGSSLIMPISAGIHILLINFSLLVLTPETYLDSFAIISYNLAWLLISLILNFYTVERKERFISSFHKFVRHYFIFTLAYIAVFSFRGVEFEVQYQLFVLTVIFLLLSFSRWSFFYLRKIYRLEGGNYVNVVVIGFDRNYFKIRKIFNEPDFGYRLKGYFHREKVEEDNYLGSYESCFKYILDNGIDEIYCMVSQLSSLELQNLISFADNNFKRLKIVPDNGGVATRAMNAELFDTIPVLNLRKSPLEMNYAKYGKRFFDIIFSIFIILFLLSWLIPLLFIIMKIESAGPLFFKQLRHGYNKRAFWCYKFRSMKVNQDANKKMCTRNDSRITRLGKILRRTNIDELPQFFNVLLGDMSVVGPRPHMEVHTLKYAKSVDKYLVRHFAKPGITGLAQIKGYRGEIEKPSDIINRTRLDIFYLEKWCPILDVKIIIQTIINCVKGQEKAF